MMGEKKEDRPLRGTVSDSNLVLNFTSIHYSLATCRSIDVFFSTISLSYSVGQVKAHGLG